MGHLIMTKCGTSPSSKSVISLYKNCPLKCEVWTICDSRDTLKYGVESSGELEGESANDIQSTNNYGRQPIHRRSIKMILTWPPKVHYGSMFLRTQRMNPPRSTFWIYMTQMIIGTDQYNVDLWCNRQYSTAITPTQPWYDIMMNAYKYGPRVFISVKQDMILTMWIKVLMSNMEISHLVINQYDKPLIDARETTNNEMVFKIPQCILMSVNICVVVKHPSDYPIKSQ